MLLVYDPLVLMQGTLVMYSTTSNLTVAYNVGAAGGVMYGMQVTSGLVIAMSYVASDEGSFSTLDAAQRDASYG